MFLLISCIAHQSVIILQKPTDTRYLVGEPPMACGNYQETFAHRAHEGRSFCNDHHNRRQAHKEPWAVTGPTPRAGRTHT